MQESKKKVFHIRTVETPIDEKNFFGHVRIDIEGEQVHKVLALCMQNDEATKRVMIDAVLEYLGTDRKVAERVHRLLTIIIT